MDNWIDPATAQILLTTLGSLLGARLARASEVRALAAELARVRAAVTGLARRCYGHDAPELHGLGADETVAPCKTQEVAS